MDKAQALRDLYADLERTAPTLPLAKKATDIVPGEGNPEAEIFFIGEAPGYNEAVQRRPFVGVSGKFLRKTMGEVGLKEKEVYIGNIVKVRPPDNRDPLPNEIVAYKPFLDREIEIIQPLLIVTLGRFSMNKFLPDVKISQVHGRLHKIMWNSKPLFILPMYHPAAALRGTQMREAFAHDMKKIPKALQWVKGQQEALALESEIKDALL